MININIHYNNVEEISSFVVSGHANSGPYGQDLVCAAVSAVTFGAVNAVLEITNAPLHIEQGGEGGYLKIDIPTNLSQDMKEKVELLFQGMLISLKTIERDYEEYVSIHKAKGR